MLLRRHQVDLGAALIVLGCLIAGAMASLSADEMHALSSIRRFAP